MDRGIGSEQHGGRRVTPETRAPRALDGSGCLLLKGAAILIPPILTHPGLNVRTVVRTQRSPQGAWDVIVDLARGDREAPSRSLKSLVDSYLSEACRRSSPTERVRLIIRDCDGLRRPIIRYVYPGRE
jgi:hypothetical protein